MCGWRARAASFDWVQYESATSRSPSDRENAPLVMALAFKNARGASCATSLDGGLCGYVFARACRARKHDFARIQSKTAAFALQPHKTSPAAAYPPLLAPPPAPCVGYTSWGTPRPMGGAVRPVTAPQCGKLEGPAVGGASESVLSDDFVALAPTYASTRGHLQPR